MWNPTRAAFGWRSQAILAAAAMLGCLSAYGQSSPPVTVAAVESAGAPAGVTIANTTSATVTAVALEWNLPVQAASKVSKTLAIKFYDVATEPLAAKPIPPNGSVTLPYAAGAESSPRVLAVLFASGATWGDAAWIARLTQRRAYMRQSLVAALADLNAAAADATATKQSLIAQFQAAQTAEQTAAANADQRACIHTVRGIILTNLQGLAPLNAVLKHEIGALQTRLAAVQANAVGQ